MILSVDVKEATFNYGDKLYRIESERQKEFKEPCKICDDEGKITYRVLRLTVLFAGITTIKETVSALKSL